MADLRAAVERLCDSYYDEIRRVPPGVFAVATRFHEDLAGLLAAHPGTDDDMTAKEFDKRLAAGTPVEVTVDLGRQRPTMETTVTSGVASWAAGSNPEAGSVTLAGQREQIAATLTTHQWSSRWDGNEDHPCCWCGWTPEDEEDPGLEFLAHFTDSLLATLVDLRSDAARRVVERALEAHLPDSAYEAGCRLACGYDGTDMDEHLAANVLAALTSGEQS